MLENEFHLFGLDHSIVLCLTLLISGIFIIGGRRFDEAWDRPTRLVFAVALLLNGVCGWIVATVQGYVVIPLNLCDLALLAGVWALITLQGWACQLVYFWGLAGSLQALLTPDLDVAFPNFWWFRFFFGHAGVVLCAVFLAATQRVQPTLRSVAAVWLITNIYVVAVGYVNWKYGTNFGYLAAKPDHPSLLDYFGPWPYYIAVMELAGTSLLLILYLPLHKFRSVGRKGV